MKDGEAAGGPDQVVVSSQDLYEDYLNWYLQPGSEVRPCGDTGLQVKAAQFLSREADLSHTFTLFPFQQAVREKCEDQSRDRRKHLTAFIKAAEVLETICVNLFLQPWRKEIKSLKTFTGAYVYFLLPVFSSSTLQSVLASIGYLPHNDASQREFRLSADADPKTAIQLGFELLLARVQCYHLLDRLVEDQLGPQEWLEALDRREQHKKLTDHTEKKTKLEDMKDNKEETRDNEEVSVDLESSPASKPQPKPRRYHLNSADQSVMEMQKEYSDLAFRGRPLVPEQLHKAHGGIGSKNIASNAVGSKRNSVKGSKAPTLLSGDGFSKAEKSYSVSAKTGGSADDNNGRTPAPSDVSASDEQRVDDELSGPQAISLYTTWRTEHEAEPRPRTRKPPSSEEYPARTRQQADGENMSVAKQEFESSSSTDEEQKLRDPSERMGHLCVRENTDGARRTKENPKGEENPREAPRQKEKKSLERGAAKQNLKMQEMETGEVVSHDPSRNTKSAQPEWKLKGEQKHPSVPTESSANCKSLQEGKASERGQTGRAEETLVTLC